STRLRNDEPQSFNWLHVRRNNEMDLQVIVWDGAGFRRASHVEYVREGEEWTAKEVVEPVRVGAMTGPAGLTSAAN
ncbi:MAG TPA: phosphohydrolase, partial [Sphingobium sp.]|nr:phosphohydrolase [Sphingobium sp.]